MNYLSDIYSKMGVELDPAENYFEVDSRFMLLEKTLRDLPAGKVCDLGCGRGALLNRLRDRHSCSGTDFDSGAVQHCATQGLTVRQVDLNNAAELPFPNVTFDAIVISEVCEHLFDPRNALRLAKRHLRSGGTLVVTVPNALPLFARLKLLFGKSVDWLHYPSPDTEKTGHIRFYTKKSMTRLLAEEGFAVVKVSGVSFRMNGSFWGRLCYWLPRLLFIRSKTAPTKIDLCLGRLMPGVAPGLFFVCGKF